jgi:hypothetical protein
MDAKTVVELRKLAKTCGLAGCSKLKKVELIGRLIAEATPEELGSSVAAGSGAGRPSATRPDSASKGRAADKSASRKTRAKEEPKERLETGPQVLERWELLSPRTCRAFSQYRARCEQRVKASKYYLGVQESAELDEAFEYPDTHGESVVTLMVRDPYWLFAYWELAPGLASELVARIGEENLARSRMVLRVYDVTGTDADHPASYHDIDVAPGARNWYINVMRVERDYCVDLGMITPDGKFIVIARSNVVSLPPVGPSDVVDEEWVTLEALDEFYAQSERGPSSGSGGWGSGGWGRE